MKCVGFNQSFQSVQNSFPLQVYNSLSQVNLCVSYPATLSLDEVNSMHTVPLRHWITDGEVFKFWGDNVDKKTKVRGARSDLQGQMFCMFSILVGKSYTPATSLSHLGQLSTVSHLLPRIFLPTQDDVNNVKANLVIIISRVLTQYISGLAPLHKSIPKHIKHKYTPKCPGSLRWWL